MQKEILEPPSECLEIAGYILVITHGKEWLTQNGQTTTVFSERGVWSSFVAAEKAKSGFTHETKI